MANEKFTSAPVVIIGAGFSGICMAIDLIKRNKCRDFVILEKSSGVGGTWNDNKYPGCCCDVFSALYSYSFEQNPNWSREYPGQEELLAYLINIAEKYGLYKHIRFNSAVEEARWDDENCKWKVSVNVAGVKDREYTDSYIIECDFLASAVGQLNEPRFPDIPGLEDFDGKLMHSARWDWSYDLAGKRVAIIGNGATAAQIVPEVAKTVSHLAVYQRSPNWVIPRLDAPVSSFQQALLKYIPPLRWRKRGLQMDFREAFHDVIADSNSSFAQIVRQASSSMMKAQIKDKPHLWEGLTPNYAPGCKRLIISDDYYPALNQDNVDLETRRIAQITPKGVETEDDEVQEYDCIILATGFRTVEFMHPIQVYGRNGRALSDIWQDGAAAYQGVTVEDLPNFGMFYGPNTNLGHNSIILMIEAQSRYLNTIVSEILKARRNGKSLAFCPTPDAMHEFNDRIQLALAQSSFADPNCSSWYKQANGKITNNWPGTVVNYQTELAKVKWTDYIVEGSGKEAIQRKKTTNIGRVREETVLSNTSLLLGALSVAAIAGYYWKRSKL